MPKPLAICIENLDARNPEERYLRCTAVPGRQPGLRVDRAGTVLWREERGVACELWVSADDRMILFRPEGADPVEVHRQGRSLDVPHGKPVVLLDQDRFHVGSRRFRLHVHGTAPAVRPPSPLSSAPRPASSLPRAAAAAVALGAAALGGAGCPRTSDPGAETTPVRGNVEEVAEPTDAGEPIDVRVAPPAPMPGPYPDEPIEPTPPPPAPPPPDEPSPPPGTGTVPDVPPIDVRMNPPDMAVD